MFDNNFQSFQFSFQEVAPTQDEILDFIQSKGIEEDHPVNITLKEIRSKLSNHNEISGGYVIKQISSLNIKEGTIQIGEEILNIERQIAGYLKGASHCALFVCTAGDIFTQLTKAYNAKGDILEAYIADSMGSLTVENAMDKIQNILTDSLIKDGLKISNRYSPGYCNWALSGQKSLFNLIGDNPVNITLSDSCLMTPIKSVSGIIGIGTDIKKREYGCSICNNASCIYRKILNQKTVYEN